jgi:hypothetical protein
MSNIIGRCSGVRSTVYMKVGGGGVFQDTDAEIFQKSRSPLKILGASKMI